MRSFNRSSELSDIDFPFHVQHYFQMAGLYYLEGPTFKTGTSQCGHNVGL